MKKAKQTLAFLLVASILIGATGCGKDDKSQTDSKSGDNTTAVVTNEAQSDPVALKIHYHAENKFTLADEDGNILPVFQLAAKRTNVTLESTANPVAQDSAEQFQLQATKQFPADIYGGTALRDSIFSYAHEGAFIPLNDLIDKYAPDIKAYLEANPDVRNAMTDADGNIYMLNYIPDGTAARVWTIRTDWMKDLGYEMPKTVEELETILYAFRNDDPNGNGKQDEIPLMNRKWQEIVRTANLWGARVFGNDNYNERVVMTNDGKFYHAWTDPAFKNALINMAQWYKDGIIDPEFVTRKTNSARDTLWTKDNTGGCTHDWLGSTISYNTNEDLLASVPDFKIEALLPPSYDGKPGFEEHQRALLKPDGVAISANCKNPEAAIKFLNFFYTEEGNRAINFGIEGDSYTMVDGKPVFTDEVLSQTGGVNMYLEKNYGAQFRMGFQQDFEYERQWLTPDALEAYTTYMDSDAYSTTDTPIMNFTDAEREIYDTYITGLNTYLDEEVQAFITGKKDVEKDWDSYVAKCNDLGAQKLVDMYQNIYDTRFTK